MFDFGFIFLFIVDAIITFSGASIVRRHVQGLLVPSAFSGASIVRLPVPGLLVPSAFVYKI